jgi:AraC-like DNA-binding protein
MVNVFRWKWMHGSYNRRTRRYSKNATTMTRPHAPGPRGILQRKAATPNAGHTRLLPANALRAFIEHFWIVRWDLRGQEPQLAETLPHPSVYWITENRTSTINGVPTRRFSRMLKGKGRVFGVKFRPGGFYPFLRSPVAAFTDAHLTPGAAFGAAGRVLAAQLKDLSAAALNADDETAADERMIACVERFLLARLPQPDPQLAVVTEIAGAIAHTHAITKVDQIVGRFGITKRALQRLFNQYVGVSPKWMIKRRRSSASPPAAPSTGRGSRWSSAISTKRISSRISGRSWGKALRSTRK